MNLRQAKSMVNSGHLPIQTICELERKAPRVFRPGLVLTIALVSLSIGIVLGQAWAHAQEQTRARLAMTAPTEGDR